MTKPKEFPPRPRDRAALDALLRAAFESADPEKMLDAIGAGAKVFGISELSRVTGRRREKLYSALSAAGNPGFKDVVKILRVLGFNLIIQAPKRCSHPMQSDVARLISALQSEGVTSCGALAQALNDRGVPTAQGFRAWSPIQVSRVLGRMAKRSDAAQRI